MSLSTERDRCTHSRDEARPNQDEIATILVEGRRFDDWESVWIQHRWNDPYPHYRFTAAERDPIPTLWSRLQFKPGDESAIYLGGVLAIAGIILIRQASYDANSHGVMLQGVGVTWFAARGSILDKKGNFDDMTFEQVARKVIAPFGVGICVVGKLNAIPFKKLQVEHGETLWNFLERIARPRGIVLGSDYKGNMLLIDDHTSSPMAELIEGHNILKCQATISIKEKFSAYRVDGSTPATDDMLGDKAAGQSATVPGRLRKYSPLLTVAEQPVWTLAEVMDRAKNEAVWHEGTDVQANVTVQGWFMPRGGLWRAGDTVVLKSPMAMINMGMKIRTVTFTQDSSAGTLTTLDLVVPWLLKDKGFKVGTPSAELTDADREILEPPGPRTGTSVLTLPEPAPVPDPPAPTIPPAPSITSGVP